MAITKPTTLKGLEVPNAYHKITGVNIVSTDVEWIYNSWITVNSYTDETKEFEIKQYTYPFEWITEAQFTLSACYEGLKTLPEFEWALDA